VPGPQGETGGQGHLQLGPPDYDAMRKHKPRPRDAGARPGRSRRRTQGNDGWPRCWRYQGKDPTPPDRARLPARVQVAARTSAAEKVSGAAMIRLIDERHRPDRAGTAVTGKARCRLAPGGTGPGCKGPNQASESRLVPRSQARRDDAHRYRGETRLCRDLGTTGCWDPTRWGDRNGLARHRAAVAGKVANDEAEPDRGSIAARRPGGGANSIATALARAAVSSTWSRLERGPRNAVLEIRPNPALRAGSPASAMSTRPSMS